MPTYSASSIQEPKDCADHFFHFKDMQAHHNKQPGNCNPCIRFDLSPIYRLDTAWSAAGGGSEAYP